MGGEATQKQSLWGPLRYEGRTLQGMAGKGTEGGGSGDKIVSGRGGRGGKRRTKG